MRSMAMEKLELGDSEVWNQANPKYHRIVAICKCNNQQCVS